MEIDLTIDLLPSAFLQGLSPSLQPIWCLSVCISVDLQQQQLQAQHLSHAAHGPPVQLPPHPSGLQPPGIPPVTGSGSGLLALGALGSQAHLPVKDEKNHHDLEHRALRTPLSIAGSYPTPFAMMGHHEMNGTLTSPGVYAGLHISPQMSAAAAAAYGRSPMVTTPPLSLCHLLSYLHSANLTFLMTRIRFISAGLALTSD
ncbi:hypothetical protein XENOCAPTIV_019819 [Xenoophorus captivus]|uniref:Uncharacterized protein n=1 Tax=Xenoophorus captivus TaxID=1517983 RepID=A0ABV0RUK0_9TELE